MNACMRLCMFLYYYKFCFSIRSNIVHTQKVCMLLMMCVCLSLSLCFSLTLSNQWRVFVICFTKWAHTEAKEIDTNVKERPVDNRLVLLSCVSEWASKWVCISICILWEWDASKYLYLKHYRLPFPQAQTKIVISRLRCRWLTRHT